MYTVNAVALFFLLSIMAPSVFSSVCDADASVGRKRRRIYGTLVRDSIADGR